MKKKITRSHRFHPTMLKLLKKCAETMKLRAPFTFIEIAIIKEAERMDVIRLADVEKYYQECRVRI